MRVNRIITNRAESIKQATVFKISCLIASLLVLNACNSRPAPAPTIETEAQSVVQDFLVSKSSNRSSSSVLDTTAVSGKIYVFTAQTTSVKQVDFYVDDVKRAGTPYQTELQGPYDLRGGSTSSANALDTTTLTDGMHTVTAWIRYTSGGEKVATASFLVANGGRLADNLLVSPAPDRSGAKPLSGSSITGKMHVFVVPSSSVKQISFYLDDASHSGKPKQTERVAFYDFGGTASAGTANPIDTSVLKEGSHTITAVILTSLGQTRVLSASFTVGTSVEPDPTPTPDPAPGDIVYSSPITITMGGTYTGNWQSLDENVPAVTVRTSESVIIENANIRSKGHLIETVYGSNVNLTVRNVKGYAIKPTTAGRYPGRFLRSDAYSYISVTDSYMEGTSGIWMAHSTVGATVKILRNKALNIDGRKSDGNGGYSGWAYAQFVQFGLGYNLTNTEVAWNEVINEPYKSRVEDVISLYRTSGSASSPVKIHDNYIQGSYPSNPGSEDFSGGGIMLGDAGGAYLEAFDNQVVSTANYGIAIAGGEHNRIYNNRVVSCGYLADGTYIHDTNLAYYIWHYSTSAPWGDNIGWGNHAGWTSLQYGGVRNDWWVPDATSWTDNTRLAPANEAVPCSAEAAEYKLWLQKRNL